MSSRRTRIVVATALALTMFAACRERPQPPQPLTSKPVAMYVSPTDLSVETYVEPGQKLEWRVNNAQSPSFTFTPQAGLCVPATVVLHAAHHNPAGCVVAPQTYPPGTLFNTYTYTLQLDTAPGAQDPPPTTHTLRVGSCGPC